MVPMNFLYFTSLQEGEETLPGQKHHLKFGHFFGVVPVTKLSLAYGFICIIQPLSKPPQIYTK